MSHAEIYFGSGLKDCPKCGTRLLADDFCHSCTWENGDVTMTVQIDGQDMVGQFHPYEDGWVCFELDGVQWDYSIGYFNFLFDTPQKAAEGFIARHPEQWEVTNESL